MKDTFHTPPHTQPGARPGWTVSGLGGLFAPEGGALASGEALHRILADINKGVLRPGEKLKIRELKERYGISASPLREALSQLAALGHVLLEDRRGFHVPPISLAELEDISQTRQIVEGEALRMAIANGGSTWEGELLSSLHQLKRELECRDPSSQEWLNAYENRHRQFHRALIAACPYSLLRDFCERLYVQMTRYRRFLKEQGFTGGLDAVLHESLAEAVLEHDAEAAVSMLRDHISVPASVIGKYLEQDIRLKTRKKRQRASP